MHDALSFPQRRQQFVNSRSKGTNPCKKLQLFVVFLDFIIPNPDCQPFGAYAFFASKALTLLTVKFMLVFHAEVEKELSL